MTHSSARNEVQGEPWRIQFPNQSKRLLTVALIQEALSRQGADGAEHRFADAVGGGLGACHQGYHPSGSLLIGSTSPTSDWAQATMMVLRTSQPPGGKWKHQRCFPKALAPSSASSLMRSPVEPAEHAQGTPFSLDQDRWEHSILSSHAHGWVARPSSCTPPPWLLPWAT